jgi:hypothetical protein
VEAVKVGFALELERVAEVVRVACAEFFSQRNEGVDKVQDFEKLIDLCVCAENRRGISDGETKQTKQNRAVLTLNEFRLEEVSMIDTFLWMSSHIVFLNFSRPFLISVKNCAVSSFSTFLLFLLFKERKRERDRERAGGRKKATRKKLSKQVVFTIRIRSALASSGSGCTSRRTKFRES